MADRSYKLTLSLSDGSTINAGTITAPQGPNGANGVTFTPSVSESGVLSWTNNGGLTNPSPISIKGPKGDDAVITESDVEGWGFTRNAGTITEIKMNGESKGINGVVDLGTVLTDASKFATSAQGTNADSALSKANTNSTEISTIKTTYQTKTDTTLETTSKTVIGAINEVKGTADNAVQSFEAEATIDNTTGTPTVDVVKSGEGTAPTYTFNFKHLKGADGRQGEAGLVYNKLYSSTINPDIVGSQTITIPTSDFNRIPKTNETFILFNQHGYYLEATVSSITVENNIQVAKCLIVPSKAVNINGTNGIDGKDALVYTELFFGDISADDTWGLSLANFNRTPRVGERFIFFTAKNQYALMSVEKLYGDGMVAAGVYDHSSQYIVSTKGQDGVGVTNATAGTPVIDDEKTTTPITFSLSDGTTKEVNVEAQNGTDGAQGIGVKSITSGTPTVVNDKTNTPITITLTDNTTVDLVVSAENGKDGTSATVTIVQATGQSTTAVMSQKAVTDELNKKANSADLANVATSGSYNDLSNIPVINQDLAASGFTPVANTYYKHTGTTTDLYTNGVIYFYNGTKYASLDGSTAVTEQVTVAVDDWVLDCITYKQVPVNPIESGDNFGVLYFDTTKTPDFSAINAVLSENEDFGLDIISNAGSRSNPYNPELNITVRSFRAGRSMNGTTFTSRQWGIEYYKRSPDEEVETYFYATDELSTALGFAASGWQTARFIDMDVLFVKDTKDYFSTSGGRGFLNWDEYISKDGQWKQVPVGSSTINPFTYRASKTLGTEMNANSVVSLGYNDTASMRECVSACVAIGEVPTDSGNGIIFYSVTKPTQAVNLVVEISETTTNA